MIGPAFQLAGQIPPIAIAGALPVAKALDRPVRSFIP
jgi:hypothetical protein